MDYLFCCQKPKVDLGPEYQYLIGEWKIVSTDDLLTNTVRIEFKKKGRVIIENGPQRALNNRISKYHGMTDKVIDNQTFLTVHYEYDKKDGNLHILEVLKKPGQVDTIQLYIRSLVESDTLKSKSPKFYRVN